MVEDVFLRQDTFMWFKWVRSRKQECNAPYYNDD